MKSLETKTESEFGRGLTYCLGLFLSHSERSYMEREKNKSVWDILGEKRVAELWFNGSSDHLYELDSSRIKDKKLALRVASFQKKCLHWGHGFDPKDSPTKKDMDWAISEAKELLRLIDQNELGVETVEASWK